MRLRRFFLVVVDVGSDSMRAAGAPPGFFSCFKKLFENITGKKIIQFSRCLIYKVTQDVRPKRVPQTFLGDGVVAQSVGRLPAKHGIAGSTRTRSPTSSFTLRDWRHCKKLGKVSWKGAPDIF